MLEEQSVKNFKINKDSSTTSMNIVPNEKSTNRNSCKKLPNSIVDDYSSKK